MNDDKCVVPVPMMSVKIAPLTAVGSGGTSDYNKLKNQPSVNDITLVGNKTLDELGIQPAGDYVEQTEFAEQLDEINKKIDEKQDVGDYALKTDIPSIAGLASESYVDGKIDEVKQDIPDTEGIKHDIENLTELVTENQDKLITSFTTGKPDGTGLVKVSAVTKNGNIDAFSVYNNIDGKYPYSAFGAQSAKEMNDRLKSLENNVLAKDNTTEYEPETDYNPATKKYVDSIKNDIPVALSQLKNDLWNEAKSREEAQTLSQQNPGKFYFCQEKEESEE